MAETSTVEAPVTDEAAEETQNQTVETPQETAGTNTDESNVLSEEAAEQLFTDTMKERQARDGAGTEPRDAAQQETERPVDQVANEAETPAPDKESPFTDEQIATLKTMLAQGGSVNPQEFNRLRDTLNGKYGTMSETVNKLKADIFKQGRSYVQVSDIEGLKESAPDVHDPLAAKIAAREEQESVERATAEEEARRKSEQVSPEDIDKAVELKLLRRAYKDWEVQVGPNTPFQQWLTTQDDADDILNTKMGSVLEDALDRFHARDKPEGNKESNNNQGKPKQTHRQRVQAAEVPESDRNVTRQKADETLTDEQLFDNRFAANVKRGARG